MDEQRQQAYVNLIEQLFDCASEEELAEALKRHAEWVDAGLLEVMQQYAEDLNSQGNGDAAQWLLNLVGKLAQAMGIAESGVESSLENPEQFLLAVLQLVAKSRGDTQQVYLFLAQHHEKLDEQLLQILPQVVVRFLAGELKQQQAVAAIFVRFSDLIQQFPLGQRWLNLELGITTYKLALQVYTHEVFPEDWAMTQNNLGNAYSDRIRGERADNLEQAIESYKLSLQVRTREAFPEDWAMTQNNLASAYVTRIRGERADNLEQAIAAFKLSLQVRTCEAFPEDWGITQNNLAIAYLTRIQGERADNLEQAIDAFKLSLQVRTREAFPEDWADTQNNLGEAYRNRIRGERADNLEQAIDAFKLSLQVRTREVFPQKWADTQNNLGNAYLTRIRGERADNLEQAIDAFKLSLQVRTREAFPQKWADIQNNLAVAYRTRIRGERANNLEQAIDALKLALQVRTREAFPEDWAMTQNNLANTYLIRIRGERADDLEQAIDALKLALQVYTHEAFPKDWAMTQNNLANTYLIRIRGERADNLEQAIDALKLALQVYTHEAFPENWAMTQNNLAVAYRIRIRGERANNLEQAIDALKLALQVYTYETFPEDWAMSQNNLGEAYHTRIQGKRADNLEQAIENHKLALQVYTHEAFPQKWADTQNNLGEAYRNRIQGERADNLEQAIESYKLALQVRTREAFPEDWADTQNNLGEAYRNRIRGERADNLEQAIESYKLALQVRTREAFPQNCRLTARNLGNLHFEQQTWAEAASAYTKALEAGEILYQSAFLLDGKAAELAETNDLPRRAAYALARSSNLQASVLTLEQGRARGLSETLAQDRANFTQLQQFAPTLYTQYAIITTQLRNLETQQRLRMTSDDRHSLTPEALRTEAQRLHQTLTQTIDQIRQFDGYEDFLAQPSFDDIRQALRPGILLLYLVPTSAGSLALIVTQDGIDDLWLDDLTETSLGELLDIWFDAYEKCINASHKFKAHQSEGNRQAYQQAQAFWFEAIDDCTRQLWQPLMAPLIDHLQQRNFQQATLIPTGLLSLLPLHAAWTEAPTAPIGRHYALDAIHFTYAPNARSLSTAQEIAQRTLTDSILAIDNPRNNLPNSTREVTAAVATFPQRKILQHEQATISDVLAALPNYNVLHLSCHGTANLDEPLNSGLTMSDGLLTLRDLLDLKLDGIRLAILSACETGLAGTALPDEAISLPTGLLQAGVAGVTASLWSVSDLSTMMLLTRFYDLWRIEDLEIDQALRHAQQWVRDTTNSQKYKDLKNSLSKLSSSQIPDSVVNDFLKEFMIDYVIRRDPNARDFAHPFHWAAFQYVGV
jgi:CHAT domain-containing protein/signal recognition particle subunit SEC65